MFGSAMIKYMRNKMTAMICIRTRPLKCHRRADTREIFLTTTHSCTQLTLKVSQQKATCDLNKSLKGMTSQKEKLHLQNQELITVKHVLSKCKILEPKLLKSNAQCGPTQPFSEQI